MGNTTSNTVLIRKIRMEQLEYITNDNKKKLDKIKSWLFQWKMRLNE